MNTFFIGITITCIVFSLISMLTYFLKERLESTENKIYSFLVGINLITLLLEMGCHYGVKYIDTSYVFWMSVLKIYIVFVLLWILTFNVYVFLATLKGNKTVNEIKKYVRKIVKISLVIFVICSLLITIFPMDVIYTSANTAYTNGNGINFILIPVGFVCFFIWLVKCFINIKELNQKKYIPILSCIVLLILIGIVQSFDRSYLIIVTCQTFVTILMFHTIENPDIIMVRALNIAKSEAEKANLAKSEFLSNMSHEIRTPLNAIYGFGQSLMEENISSNAKEEVKYILMASENLLDIVNGILDISKIEANKLEIINTKYNPYIIFDEIVALGKGRLGEKPLEFRVNIDPSIPQVLYGDYVRFRQIIINLLTNSIKYTHQGFVELKVSTLRKDNVCRLIVSVEDSGIGIPKEKIDGLFTKFERIDLEKNISIEGTGLGLAITKKLVDLMRGKIVVQSEYGTGSKFTVAIDQRIIAEVAPKEEQVISTDIANLDFSGKSVLIVDDNKINLKVAMRLLKNYNCESKEVESGFDCLDIINAGEKFDLILMDDMMPKMSGVETFEKLKEMPGFDMSVVALTANAISGMKEKYLDLGFNDYLSKPISRSELDRVMIKFLGRE